MLKAGLKSQEKTVRSETKPFFKATNLLFLVLAIVGCLHALGMIGLETYRVLNNNYGIERLNSELTLMEQDISELDALITNIDDVFMEQLARCQGYVYPNETRYISNIPEETIASLNCSWSN